MNTLIEALSPVDYKADERFDATLTKLAEKTHSTKSAVIRAAVLNYNSSFGVHISGHPGRKPGSSLQGSIPPSVEAIHGAWIPASCRDDWVAFMKNLLTLAQIEVENLSIRLLEPRNLSYKKHLEDEALRLHVRDASLKTRADAKRIAEDLDTANADGL